MGFVWVVVAYSVILGLASLAVGSEKGRSFESFLLGLLLGVVGLLVVLGLRPTPESEAEWRIDVEDEMRSYRKG